MDLLSRSCLKCDADVATEKESPAIFLRQEANGTRWENRIFQKE